MSLDIIFRVTVHGYSLGDPFYPLPDFSSLHKTIISLLIKE